MITAGDSPRGRLCFTAPANDDTAALTKRPRRTSSHAQEKQRWQSVTVKNRFNRSGKRKKKSARSGKMKKMTARHFPLEAIRIWKDCSGDLSPPCTSTKHARAVHTARAATQAGRTNRSSPSAPRNRWVTSRRNSTFCFRISAKPSASTNTSRSSSTTSVRA